MQGAPKDIQTQDVLSAIESISGVTDVHHLHIWQLDEHHNALEAHVVLEDATTLEKVKSDIKEQLLSSYTIAHSS